MRGALRFGGLGLLLFGAFLDAAITCGGRGSRVVLEDESSRLTLNTPLTAFSGTLDIHSLADYTISGSSITFSNGRLERESSGMFFSGTYDPTSSDQLSLAGNTNVFVEVGTTIPAVAVSGTGNRLAGYPTLSGAITLSDASTGLTLNLAGSVDQNITLNSGTITVENGISFASNIFFQGTGTLDFQNSTLEFLRGEHHVTGTHHFNDVGTVVLNDDVTLSGMWTFGPQHGTTVIQGNGNNLDLSLGGTIVLAAGHALLLSDMTLKGLGNGLIEFQDSNATLSVSGSTLVFEENMTITHGHYYFKDKRSTINTSNNVVNFGFDGKITLDGVTVIADALNKPTVRNVMPRDPDGITLTYLNGGIFRVPGELVYSTEDPAARTLIDSSTHQLTQDEGIYVGKELYFRGLTASTMTLQGNGHGLDLSASNTHVIKVAAGKTARIEATTLRGLKKNHIDLGAGSSLIFGTDSVIELAEAYDPSFTFSFQGSGVIDGQNHTMTLTRNKGLYLENSVTVTLRNVDLKGVEAYQTLSGQVGDDPFGYGSGGSLLIDGTSGSYWESDIEWRPQGDFLFLTPQGGGSELYEYDPQGDSFAEVTISMSESSRRAQWSPDGKFLVIGHNPIRVFSFDPVAKDFTQVSTYDPNPYHDNGWDMRTAFSPDGNYLAYAFAGGPGYEVRVLGFNKTTGALSAIAWASATTSSPDRMIDVSWHKDGEYLAVVGGDSTNQLKIYKFDVAGTSFTKETEETVFSSGEFGYVVGFSSGSDRLAIFQYGSPAELAVYDFNPGDATVSEVDRVGSFVYPYNLFISYDGSIIFTTCTEPPKSYNVHEVVSGSLVQRDTVNNSRGSGLSFCDTTSRVAWFISNRGVNPNQNRIWWKAVQGVASEVVATDHTNLSLADSARIALSDCRMHIDTDYTFSSGSMDILGDVCLTSSWAKFAYKSSNPLTIKRSGHLALDRDITFSYDSAGGSSKLVFDSVDSQMRLGHGTTLYATTTGLNLSVGQLLIDGIVTMSSEATTTSQSPITLESSIDCHLLSGATLKPHGRVVYA